MNTNKKLNQNDHNNNLLETYNTNQSDQNANKDIIVNTILHTPLPIYKGDNISCLNNNMINIIPSNLEKDFDNQPLLEIMEDEPSTRATRDRRLTNVNVNKNYISTAINQINSSEYCNVKVSAPLCINEKLSDNFVNTSDVFEIITPDKINNVYTSN